MNENVAETDKERLKQILKKKANKQQVRPIDWDDKKQTWLDQLSLLYRQIEQWLKDIENINIQRQQVRISEEYIGRYEADRLLIYAGDNLITFTPRGTLIMAARGRIDVHSSNNMRAMIILEKKGERPELIDTINFEPPPPKPDYETIEYEWLIAGEKGKDLIVLNENSFTDFIADLVE